MFHVPEQFRITRSLANAYSFVARLDHLVSTSAKGNSGGFAVPPVGKTRGLKFICIASDGEGWEHVSVSLLQEKRCPTWEEMCYIKSLFWSDDEGVMQLHPPRKDYVNNHQFCLHLWRPINAIIPLPPSLLVGLAGKTFSK